MWARSGTGLSSCEVAVRDVGTGGVVSMLLMALLLSKIPGRLLKMVLVSGLRLTVERVRPVLTKLVVLWELMLLSLLMVVVPALMMSVLLSGGVLRGWCEGVRNKGLMGGEGEDDSDEGPEDVGCGW
jgi:hypothetical protein